MAIYIKLGQIVNTHGHKGGLKIYPLTDDPGRFARTEYLYIKTGQEHQRFTISEAKLHKNLVLLTLKEIIDMNEAEKLKGLYVELPQDELPSLEEGHFYIFQIIGLDVYEGQELLGKITDVLKTGSNDVYVIQREQGGNIYLPALKEVVHSINVESGKMIVTLPPGLTD